MQHCIYKGLRIQPRRRASLLLLAGLIHTGTLTERNRLDIVPRDDYAGTNARMDLVLPKTGNCIRSMKILSMTEYLATRFFLKLAVFGHAHLGDLGRLTTQRAKKS